MEATEDLLYPKGSLEGRSNFKRYHYIARDGSITERVYLHVLDKRLREEIICIHFLQFLAKHIVKDELGVNFQSRDNPWDFGICLSDGTTMNLEIVSIADNRRQHEFNLREERRDADAHSERIRLRELVKLAKNFPDKELEDQITHHLNAGCSLDSEVPNPDFNQGGRMYVGRGEPRAPLHEILHEAIVGKERKAHSDKETTVLIIDNRTSIQYVHEVTEVASLIQDRIYASPFKEIWFYNGYCSDNDGNNGEYTMIGLKVSSETTDRFSLR